MEYGKEYKRRPSDVGMPRCDRSYPQNRRISDDTRNQAARNSHPSQSLVMVYSPYQAWENIYDCAEALQYGTLFADLNLPWQAACCRTAQPRNGCKGGCGDD